MTMPRFLFFLLVLLCFSTLAQAQGTCPTDLFLALSRAYAVCTGAERNTLCYGSGAIESAVYPVMEATFAQPGDIAAAGAMQSIQLDGSAEDRWGISYLRLQANLPLVEERSITLLLFGDASVQNLIPPVPELNVTAFANVNMRQEPTESSEIVEQARIGSSLVANGRTSDSGWIRVQIPNSNATSWISADTLTPANFSVLNVVDSADIPRRPFEEFILTTGSNDSLCDGAPESGAFLQTPNDEDEVQLLVNGARLRITGTAFLQADGALTVSVLSGLARLEAGGTSQTIPVGGSGSVTLGDDKLVSGIPTVSPYAAGDIPEAPLNFLDIHTRMPEPLTTEALASAIQAADATPIPDATPTPTPVQCQRVIEETRNIRRGPGTEYPVVGALEANTVFYPIAQTTNPDGEIWWKLSSRQWILPAEVTETGPCDPLPETPFVSLPRYNTLVLETCAPSNGPLRAGQEVDLIFTPPSWDTLDEAQLATYHDRGRIQVGDRRLHTYVSAPTLIDDNQYIRQFGAEWRAQPGTNRIAGTHLAYQIICNVTVEAGE